MDSPVNKCQAKQLHDQDSSSMQSTGQSQQVGGGEGSLDGSFSAHSGSNGAYLWQVKGKNQPVITKATPDIFFPLSQSMVCVPYPCADPYSGCYLPAVGPQYTQIHPQIGLMTPSRVPLPPDFGENEPIYVNSKQYRGILRRRESRARLEAQNRLAKDRKPYLHESRHLHALKRARGCGGRFLNTKKLPQSERTSTIGAQIELDSASVQQSGSLSESDASKSETGNMATSATSSCEVTLLDKENTFRPSNPWLSGYPPRMVIQDGGGGMVFNGSQLRVPAIQ